MIDPVRFNSLDYVRAAAPAVGLSLTPERLQDIAAAFALVVQVAQPALTFSMPTDTEPAPIFTP